MRWSPVCRRGGSDRDGAGGGAAPSTDVSGGTERPDLRSRAHQTAPARAHLSAGGESVMIRIGIAGYGYWGPNVARCLSQVDGASVVAIGDRRAEALAKAG